MTTTTYDALSRPLKVVDGGGGETDYAYHQNDVLTTVQGAGGAPAVARQRQLDGLGRLSSVCEITTGTGTGGNWPGGSCGQTYNAGNGYLTSYTYNPLGQITAVTQNAQGSSRETRALQYDELGRLTEETNPETKQLPVYYTYDRDAACGTAAADAGALVKRISARGITTCYHHDSAGRLDQVTYSDGTPAKYYVYGRSNPETDEGFAVNNGIGRLVEAYTGGHATDEVFAYNKLGRITLAAEATPDSAGWYQVYANYFFNGTPDALLLENAAGADLLPGEIFYTADGEGRPAGATYGSNPLVTTATYSALGLESETYASGDGHTDTDTHGYDPNTGRETSYTFAVDGYADAGTYGWLANGELGSFSVSDSVPGAADNGFGCSYTHDDLGRLSAANCGASSAQTFTFDPFGNVCKTADAGTNFCPAYNLYNQITSASYDADGDETSDPVKGLSNAFDAEGRPTTFMNTAVIYDALGRAVEANGEEFVYAPGGGKIAVMKGQTLERAEIPLAGGARAVFTGAGFAYYRHADALGSARLATSYAGALTSSEALAPYGEPLLETGTRDRSFTGQNQDISNGAATGSDGNGQYDFPAREYGPTQSRWWSPDPAGLAAVDPASPQSWNRYAYVNGNPLAATDPTGLEPCRPVAKLHVDFSDSDKAGASADGPYDPGFESGAADGGASGDDGYSGCASPVGSPFDIFSVDGTVMDAGLGMNLGGWGAGGLSGAGSSDASDIHAYNTVTPPSYVDPNGVPRNLQWTEAGPAAECPANQQGMFTCCANPTWGWKDLGPAQRCGLDMGCEFFSGFVNLFLNNRPSGALQLAGAEAAIAAPSILGAAVAPYAPAALSFVGAGLGRVASNPASLDFVLGAARAAVPGAAAPLSRWGLAGASAYEVGAHWGIVENWFGAWGN